MPFISACIGLGIYGTLFLYTLSQIRFLLKKVFSVYFLRSRATNIGLNYKTCFYLVFLIFCLFEIGFYLILLIQQTISPWAFLLLDITSFLHVLIFAMVINLWGYALNHSNHHQKSTTIGIVMILLNLLATLVSLCFILVTHENGLSSTRSKVIRFLLVVAPQLVTLFIFSCVLFIYSFRLISMLSQSYGHNIPQSQIDIEVKMKLITRITVVTLICLICYLLRILIYTLTAYHFLASAATNRVPIGHGLEHPLWFLFSDWIPTVGPVSCIPLIFYPLILSLILSVPVLWWCRNQGLTFLYIMRRNSFQSSSRSSTQSLTLSRETSSAGDRVTWYYEENDEKDENDTLTSNSFTSRFTSKRKASHPSESETGSQSLSIAESPLKVVEFSNRTFSNETTDEFRLFGRGKADSMT